MNYRNTMDQLAAATQEMHAIQGRKNNPAGYMLERLQTQIKQFQLEIAEDSEIGIKVVGGGGSGMFHLRQITVSNPDMLIFDGVDPDGRQVQLIQHHSQMQVMLVEAAKLEETPYRIGFTA